MNKDDDLLVLLRLWFDKFDETKLNVFSENKVAKLIKKELSLRKLWKCRKRGITKSKQCKCGRDLLITKDKQGQITGFTCPDFFCDFEKERNKKKNN